MELCSDCKKIIEKINDTHGPFGDFMYFKGNKYSILLHCVDMMAVRKEEGKW